MFLAAQGQTLIGTALVSILCAYVALKLYGSFAVVFCLVFVGFCHYQAFKKYKTMRDGNPDLLILYSWFPTLYTDFYLPNIFPIRSLPYLFAWKLRFKLYQQLETKRFAVINPIVRTLYVADPELATRIMRRNTDFVKPTIYYKPLDLFGKNLITVEGEAWKHMHQLLAPTFGDRQMHQVVEKTHLAVDCLSIQSDVAQMTMQITFNVIGTIVYGQDMLKDHKLKPLLLSVLHNAFWYFLIPDFCLRYLPFQRTRELHQDWQDLNQELERILEKRDFLDDSTASLLSHLWLNQKMTKDDMLANFFVLMTAGFETTGRTLVLLLTLLAFHPQAMRRLQEEVDQVLGNKRFETSDLKNLPYLQGVMYETLRLYPQVPIIPKITEDDQMVGDVFVPKRTNVAIHAAALHMDPSVYPNPEAFKPERWLQKDAQSVDGSFIPFSFGPRQCIGRRFATMEIFTVVSRLIQKYEWTCTDGPLEKVLDCQVLLSTRTKNPVHLQFTER